MHWLGQSENTPHLKVAVDGKYYWPVMFVESKKIGANANFNNTFGKSSYNHGELLQCDHWIIIVHGILVFHER